MILQFNQFGLHDFAMEVFGKRFQTNVVGIMSEKEIGLEKCEDSGYGDPRTQPPPCPNSDTNKREIHIDEAIIITLIQFCDSLISFQMTVLQKGP